MRYVAGTLVPVGQVLGRSAIDSEDTDMVLQRCLNRLGRATDDAGAREIVRDLLSVAAGRILLLCGSTLHRKYPRLAKGPLNVQPEELLSAVVERLIKAMRSVHPTRVREFFALVMKHIRWELNELARGLDANNERPLPPDAIAWEEEADRSEQFSPRGRQILQVIDGLHSTDRQIFNLVRLHGMTHMDTAEVLKISTKTVQRRLNRILPQLWGQFGEQPPRRVA